jgi:hypothetical protein
MISIGTRKLGWTGTLGAVALLLLGCGTGGSALPDPAAELREALAPVRAATARFHDVQVALGAGYRPASPCEARPEGGMGIHYVHPALLGITPGAVPVSGTDAVVDPEHPEVLLYEPQPDGTLRLVGVEYLVFAAAWDAVNAAPPTFAREPFALMQGPMAHGFAPHYELHVWLWRQNPEGTFKPWNPMVTCPAAPVGL